MDTGLNIFIGFDEREADVYKLCEQSIRRTCQSSRPLNIVPLYHKQLRDDGLFDRPWRIQGQTGQYVDERDGRPFSTQFSHSRFLVPALARRMGMSGHAMFVDCDFIFKDDVESIFRQAEAQMDKSVCVVKHNYNPQSVVKMDNCVQVRHQYKLWSALMVFNLSDPYVGEMTPDMVNHKDGAFLHHFKWLPDDSHIGDIDERWNWIPDHSERHCSIEDVGAIHYTLGGPWFAHMRDCSYADIYWEEYEEWLKRASDAFKDGVIL